jgi:sugar-phosphatase
VIELACSAVLLDLDGTLIDTGAIYERHWRAWASVRGIDPDRVIALHYGRPAAQTIAIVAPELDATAEAAAYNAEVARDPDTGGLRAIEGAAALLSGLPPERWAIVTSATRTMVERWLPALGLPLPRVLVAVEDVGRGKPAPDPYVRAAELLGFSPADCVVIEDAPAGVSAGKAAGATVVALDSTHRRAELAEADHLVADLTAIDVRSTVGGLVVVLA